MPPLPARIGSHGQAMGTPGVKAAREAPRLTLVTPPLGRAGARADDLGRALNTADIAAVLVRLQDDDEAALIARIDELRILIQSNGAALLLDGRPELVARTQADGAHVSGVDAFKAAAPKIGRAHV